MAEEEASVRNLEHLGFDSGESMYMGHQQMLTKIRAQQQRAKDESAVSDFRNAAVTVASAPAPAIVAAPKAPIPSSAA